MMMTHGGTTFFNSAPSTLPYVASTSVAFPSPTSTSFTVAPYSINIDAVGQQRSQQRQSQHPLHRSFPLQRVLNASPELTRLTKKKGDEEDDGYFMSEDLKSQLLRQQAANQIKLDPDTAGLDIPVSVEGFHDFFPLEPIAAEDSGNERRPDSIIPFKSSVYRVTSEKDGRVYCMRRVHDFKLSNTKCTSVIEKWKRVHHPNVVGLRQVFTTKNAFRPSGENSIVFIHDFYPGAESLSSFLGRREAAHAIANHHQQRSRGISSFSVKDEFNSQQTSAHLLPESAIWSFVIQLSSAIRKIHGMGLACRGLSDPSKILVCGSHRLRINCTGVLDVLLFDATSANGGANAAQAVTYQQQEDLVSFGKLVLALACHTFKLPDENQAVEMVTRHYSADLKNLLGYFLGNTTRLRHINDIMPMIGARFYTQVEALETRVDRMERELTKEVENGRLFRTLAKLNTVLERPEMGLDPNWSEMGDRYILKLFRDYVFHQVTDERGTPFLDLCHVVTCLNKLDFGSPERICLMSRDEENVIIVSYADLKRSFEIAFQQLLEASLQMPFCYEGGGENNNNRSMTGYETSMMTTTSTVRGFDVVGTSMMGKTAIRGRGLNTDGF